MSRPSPKTRASETDPPTPDTPGEPMTLEERKKRQMDLPNVPHVDVDELRHASGLFSIISQRRANGSFTFAIFKGFERNGSLERTSFIPEHLGDAYGELLTLTLERIKKIRDSGTAPFKERAR